MSEISKVWIPHVLKSDPVVLFRNTNMDVGQMALTDSISYPNGFVLGDFKAISVKYIIQHEGATNFKPNEDILQEKYCLLKLDNQSLTNFQIEITASTPRDNSSIGLYWMTRQIIFNEENFIFGDCQTNHEREIIKDNDCCIIHSIIGYV